MSGTQKRGFRLPWTAERGPDDGTAAATLDPGLDPSSATEDEDTGAGPFSRVESGSQAKTAEAAMIETEPPTSEPGAGPPAGNANGAWPAADAAGPDSGRAAARPPIRVESEARPPRRENPLVAGLVKAMREAALASREETTNRLRAEATTRVEAIRAGSTDAASSLRKRAEEDIAGIREWSKAEIARVRQETEERIESRRSELAGETERHAAGIDRMVDEVQRQVAAYEADMDGFFELLLSENDPARLATLAEQAPEAPDLGGEIEGELDWQDAPVDAAAEAMAARVAEPVLDAEPEVELDAPAAESDAEDLGDQAVAEVAADSTDAEVEAAAPQAMASVAEPEIAESLEADAAAEAEAGAAEGLDMVVPDRWPAAAMGARTDAEVTKDPVGAPTGQSRLLVSGLTSVAGISAFKGAVGGLPGVRSVSVSSGERGVFIFSVNHDAGADMAEAVSGMTAFAVRVTESSGDTLTLSAHEPAA